MPSYQKQEFAEGQVLTHTDLNEMDEQIALNELTAEDLTKRIDTRTLMAALPRSQGVANAIKRAYQFTDILWTPKGDIPGVDYGPVEGRVKYWFRAGRTYKGIPYEGGVISTYTYSGLNTHIDTFITAVANPNSILYNYDSNNDKGGAYYGTVCSKLVQHALAIPATHNTASIPKLEGVETVALADQYTIDDVQLGDILCYTESHTAMVTGIYYNAYHNRKSGGETLYIEVSDAVYPVCRRRLYNPEKFYATWIKNYGLYRYKHIDSVPYVEDDYVKLDTDKGDLRYTSEYALMPYYGDKANYIQGSGTVDVHILKQGYTKAIVKRDGVIIDEINISDTTTKFTFSKATAGDIEMYLEDASGNKSSSVYAKVVKATITVENSAKYDQGELLVSYTGTSGTPLYAQFGTDQTQNLRLDGLGPSIIHSANSATLKFNAKRASTNLRVAYQNEYGTYYSSTIKFTPAAPGEAENTSTDTYLAKGTYFQDYTVTADSSEPVASATNWAYTNVPVEANTKYQCDSSATVVWCFNGTTPLNCIDLSTQEVPYQFETPDSTTVISIANASTLTRIGATNAITDVALSETGAIFMDKTNLSSSSYATSENESYFVYSEIPVEAGATYYTRGAARSWFLDSSKKQKSTINLTSADPKYVFTVPSGVSYISIAYVKAVKDITYIRKLSQ